VALEGELCVRIQLAGGRVSGARVASTRPDVARLLLQGRTREEIVAAVPRLFAVCAHAQGLAAQLACAAASGEAWTPNQLQDAMRTLVHDTTGEVTRTVLLSWPRWLGEKPTPDALAAARGGDTVPMDDLVFAMPAEEWLGLETLTRLRRWADTGVTPAARLVAQELNRALPQGKRAGPALPGARLLEGTQHAEWVGELALAFDADTGFVSHPCWCGTPAEAGPLARRQADPLLRSLLQRPAARLVARLVARLRELALLRLGRGLLAAGARVLSAGGAVAWVENARGLLLHRVQLDAAGRSSLYRILSPTDWNFHPTGAVALGLAGMPATDHDALERHATMLVRSLDPCVGWRLEWEGA